MKLLFLGPPESPIIEFLNSIGETVVATMDPIDVATLEMHMPDFVISHGYRHIIRKAILDRFTRKAINLHIGYLPWNKGADPNFWSFVENTPKGVTIHYLDEGVDSGDIIAQREVLFSSNETLRTSYEKLQCEVNALFQETWLEIRAGKSTARRQVGIGSYHRLRDKEKLVHLLERSWDTPVSVLEKYGAAETVGRAIGRDCLPKFNG